MGINLETRRYRMFLARCGVSVYSRLRYGWWDHLHLGLATLGTALALYSLIIGLHLLLQHEVCLPVAVLVLVYSYLSVVLLPLKDSLPPGLYRQSHPSTSSETPKNQPCGFQSMQSLMHSNHLRLTSLVIVYRLAHLFLLLLQAGDVETNPGPQTPVPTSDLAKLARLPVTAEWQTLGIQLGVSADRLRIIQSNNAHYPDRCERCLLDMFHSWLTSDCVSTYETLATALNAIGRNDLALQVCREKNLDMAFGATSNLPVNTYAEYLKSKYAGKTLIGDDKRQYASRNAAKYINLAIIRNDNIDAVEREKLVAASVRGTISDITTERGSIELGQIGRQEDGSLARCVLVQGAPGIGKTTMAWELCRQWGDGKILKEYSLLVLLKLRDRCVQKATSIADLFFDSGHSLQSALVSQITESHGRQTLFLLEGYDELPLDLQENSIFAKVIDGDVLPKAGVIVTSRPSAIDMLRKQCYGQVCQQIEVLGFTEQQINSYVKARFGDEHDQHQFEAYLTCYPHIAALMAIPVNCSIVIDVYQSSKSLGESVVPRTQTELYSALTRILLGRHLTAHKVHGNTKWNLQTIADLPSNIEQDLIKLSEVAYTGIIQQQLIFHTVPSNLETMGFMNQEHDEQGLASFHFLHLTVQEFLAAFYVSKLPLSEQAQILDDSVGKNHLVIMLRFIAGLTKFHVQQVAERSFSGRVSKFVKGLFKSRGPADCLRTMYHGSKDNSMESLRWMFETQDKVLLREALGTETQTLNLARQTLAPFDCYIIADCISNSDCRWRLDFRSCQITETGMRMLAGRTGGSLINVETIDLSHNALKTGGVHLASALRGNTVLTELTLGHCRIDAEGTAQLADVLCGITTLRVLNLSWNTVGTQGARHLASALRGNTVLTELRLEDCRIDAEGTAQLANVLCGITTLRELNLSWNTVGTQGARYLASALRGNTVLTELRLERCDIDAERTAQLADVLCGITTLRVLDLSQNTVDTQGARHLASALRGNTVLTVLRLSDCHIDAEGTAQLADVLSGITTLRALNLSHNTVGTQGARHLALLLRRTHSLTALGLDSCSIGEDAACQLAEGIRANSSLTELLVWGNPLGLTGTQALVDSLAYNTSIQALWLPNKLECKDTIMRSVVYSRVSSRILIRWGY